MSSVYTPSTASFTATATLPSDGDAPTAASVNTPIETALDNAAYLEDKAFFGIEGYYPVPLGGPFENTNTRLTANATLCAWVQTDITDAGAIWWAVQTPIKGRITELWAEIEGAGGPGGVGHAGKPGTLPTVSLYRVAYSEAGLTLVTTATDAPADAAAYDAVHSFGSTGLTEDIGSARSYLVKFTGEDGANKAVDELALYKIMLKLEATP